MKVKNNFPKINDQKKYNLNILKQSTRFTNMKSSDSLYDFAPVLPIYTFPQKKKKFQTASATFSTLFT